MKIKKITAIICVFSVLAGMFASCSKDNSETENNNSAMSQTDIPKSTLLTHVYSEEELSIPDGFIISESSVNYKDGMIRMYGTKRVNVNGKYGNEHYIYEVSSDGSNQNETKLEIEGDVNINTAFISDDTLLLVDSSYNTDTQVMIYDLIRYNFSDETVDKLENITSFYPNSDKLTSQVNSAVIDKDGYIYYTNGTAICVISPDMIKLFDCVSNDYINNLALSGDGCVYAVTSSSVNKVDVNILGLGTELSLPEGTAVENCFFGNGYDLYYSTEEGLFGYSDGMDVGEMVVNWNNSNIIYEPSVTLKIFSPEMMFISYYDNERINSILKKSNDIDTSEISVIEIAGVYLDDSLKRKIIHFNKESKTVHVRAREYSVYNNAENSWNGGSEKIINDILGGIYTPDIICERNSHSLIKTAYKNKIYTDLYEFIDNDPDVNRDDIVGVIKNTYETDGKLAAITPKFSVNTLIAPKSFVGEREEWTIDNMLDLEEGLDDGVALISDRDSWFVNYSPYYSFIDIKNGTCDFNNPTFIKLLGYISKPRAEIKRTANVYEPYQSGKVALCQVTYRYIDDYMYGKVAYNTDDCVRIGYPKSENSYIGSVMNNSAYAYIIPNSSNHKSEAWEFIKYLLMDYKSDGFYSVDGIRALKSQNLLMKEELRDNHYFYYFDGNLTYWTTEEGEIFDYHVDENGRFGGKAGVFVEYSEDEFDKFMEFIDSAGMPITNIIPDEVFDILNEEVSVYTSGLRSAEDTADIISSRVSVWLAENK